jgi:hypothetical protein
MEIIFRQLGFVIMGLLSWREVRSVIYSNCWSSPAQSFSLQCLAWLITIFYFLNFETLQIRGSKALLYGKISLLKTKNWCTEFILYHKYFLILYPFVTCKSILASVSLTLHRCPQSKYWLIHFGFRKVNHPSPKTSRHRTEYKGFWRWCMALRITEVLV